MSNLNVIYTSDNNKPYHTSQSSIGANKLFRKSKCKCNGNCKCKSQGCPVINIDNTLELLARINYTINSLTDKIYNNIKYKFPLESRDKIKLEKLILYRTAIRRYKHRLIRSENLEHKCNCSSKIQRIFENARQLLGVGYSLEKSIHYSLSTNVPELEDGLIIDSTKLNSWLVKNPYCAPVDQWEKLAHYVCGTLGVEIEVEEIKCNLTFDIVKESVPLGVLSGLSIGKLAAKNGIHNIRTEDQCKLDWEILVEEITTCDISYDLYLQLVKDCNLSYDVIREAYDCGLSFSTRNGKHQLIGKNFTYNLSDIDFKSPITTYSSLNLSGSQLSTTNSLDKSKLDNLLSDYNLTSKQLKTLK
jgi:hypothetical protein